MVDFSLCRYVWTNSNHLLILVVVYRILVFLATLLLFVTLGYLDVLLSNSQRDRSHHHHHYPSSSTSRCSSYHTFLPFHLQHSWLGCDTHRKHNMLRALAFRRSVYVAMGAASAGLLTTAAVYSERDDTRNNRKQKNEVPLIQSIQQIIPRNFFISSPAHCDAAKRNSSPPEYHAVPLPGDDAVKTSELVNRYKIYISGNLDEICKFKKEKNGVKIYTIKEVSK